MEFGDFTNSPSFVKELIKDPMLDSHYNWIESGDDERIVTPPPTLSTSCLPESGDDERTVTPPPTLSTSCLPESGDDERTVTPPPTLSTSCLPESGDDERTVTPPPTLSTSCLPEPNGDMILSVNGVFVKTRPSGFHYKEYQSQPQLTNDQRLYGGGQKNTGKYKRNSLKGCEGVLLSVVTKQSKYNISPQGPFGEACHLLKLKNTKINRNRLRTFYVRNKLHQIVPEEKIAKLSIVGHNTERKKRQLKPRTRYSDSLFKENVSHYKFCVCQATSDTWEENGPMVQCQACNKWYHYKCICHSNEKLLKKSFHGKDIRFICGIANCKFNEGVLRVKGTTYMLKKEDDISEVIAENSFLNIDKDERDVLCDMGENVSYISDKEVDNIKIDANHSPTNTSEFQDETCNVENKEEINFICDNIDKDKVTTNDNHSPLYEDESNLFDNIEEKSIFSDNIVIKDKALKELKSGSNISEKDDSVQKENIDSFSKETISTVLGKEIPCNYFNFDIPHTTSFPFDELVWNQLYSQRNNRCFKKNTWQHYFIEGLKKSNPHCVFKFGFHNLSVAEKRSKRSNSPLFTAKGFCTFSNCSCSFTLKMFCKSLVHVYFKGNVKHDIKEKKARHIIGQERESLKKSFKSGVKPLKMFLDTLDGFTTDKLISGNRDGLGNSLNVFSKIASESRQGGRHDSNLIESLISLKDDMLTNLPGGFIRKISIYPMYILYWSDFGLQMFKDRANQNAIYWDATGSIVRPADNGKKFLYYEIAVSNPVKGKMGIPISSMISEDHSLPTILDWLQSFKQSLKKKFGHSNTLNPKFIISDQSMVLILAALKMFNDESLEQYLKRCYNCITHKESYDNNKTLLCLCTSHLMKAVKRYLQKKEIGTQKREAFLFIIGVLKQCQSERDFKELLFDIFIMTGSRYVNEKNDKYINRLLMKINTYDSKAFDTCDVENIESEFTSINPNAFNENDFQILGTSSPFKDVAMKIYTLSSSLFQNEFNEEYQTNRFYSEIFRDYLLNWLLPIFPLWSAIMHCCLSDSISKPNTNGLIENRFRILKEIYLQRRSKHRLDEFSEVLKNHTISIQKLAAAESLKAGQNKRKRDIFSKKSLQETHVQKKYKKSELVKEEWCKKNSQSSPLETRAKVGKYQKPPKKDLSLDKSAKKAKKADQLESSSLNSTSLEHLLPKSDKTVVQNPKASNVTCRLTNFGTTCWFNSVIQSIFFTDLRIKTVNSIDMTCIHLIEKSEKTLAFESLVTLWKYMSNKSNLGKKINNKILQLALTRICAIIPGFSQNQQQDAQEFISSVISDLSKLVGDSMTIMIRQTCLTCHKLLIQNVEEGSVLFVPLKSGLSNVSVQTLVDNLNFSEERTVFCSNCQKDCAHSVKRQTTVFPQTLMIVLGRFSYLQSKNMYLKLQNEIYVNDKLNIFSSHNGRQQPFNFKSAVCHYGDSVNSGHYKAIVKVCNNFFSCNDLEVVPTSDDEMLSTGYILMFDRAECNLPDIFKKLVTVFQLSNCFLEIQNHFKFQYLSDEKQKTIIKLHQAGFTKDLENSFILSVGNILHTQYEMQNRLPSVQNYLEIFLSYLLPKENTHCCSVHEELFNLIGVSTFSCKSCKFFHRIFDKTFMSTVYRKCGSKDIFLNSLIVSDSHSEQSCRCGTVTKEVSIFSLPYVLVFEYSPTFCIDLEQNSLLDFASHPNISIPYYGYKFRLEIILCKKDSCSVILKKCNDSFLHIDTQKRFFNSDILKFDQVYLFFVKINEDIEYTSLLDTISCKTHELKDLQMASISELTLSLNVLPRKIFGVKLSKQFYDTLLSETSWLNSDHINVYLSIISKTSKKKVHVLDCGWFSSRLCQTGNLKLPIHYFENVEGKFPWSEFDYIVVPVNDSNSHWSILVIDQNRKLIRYCNSFGTTLQSYIICTQIWRYICFDTFMHKNQVLKKTGWSVNFYNEELNFPTQTDNSSCGVYVCCVAKAILTNTKLPKKPNLPGFRKSIADEISNFT